jgi:hypothetical protein
MSSDARSDAHTTSTYEGSYMIGRYRYFLDFQANTDHHDLTDMDYGLARSEEMKQITNHAYEPGNFVTLIANELSHGKGDQNVYFPGDDAPFLLANVQHHPYAVWDTLAAYECFTVPHHVAQSMRPWQWENFNPELMGVVEFHGNHPHYSPHPIQLKKLRSLKMEWWPIMQNPIVCWQHGNGQIRHSQIPPVITSV